jgi:hypothetical protein|tara:strand:- start:155 stop:700 length:546 start_codon:yes stop_codon:yes gene_type:complete
MRYLFALIALMTICTLAYAANVDSPGTVYLYDEAKEISVNIVNSDETAQPFSVEFTAPTPFEVSQESGTVAGNKTKTVSITVFPRSDLVSQTYQSKLEISLGDKKFVKNINLVFRAPQGEIPPTNQVPEEPETTSSTVGLFALGAMPALTPELAFNVVLGLIAAVLLIAFIARFTKRMGGQ